MVLHTISKFEEDQLKQCAVLIVKGFLMCFNGPVSLRNEMFNSPDFWSVLQALHSHPDTAQSVFEIVENVASGSASGLTVDNFDPVISLLNDFATAGSIGAKIERRRDEAAARGKVQKSKQTYVLSPACSMYAKVGWQSQRTGHKRDQIHANRLPNHQSHSQLHPTITSRTASRYESFGGIPRK